MCREQEGNGGLDRRSQIRPKMGNLRGERFTSLLRPLLYLNIVYLFILLVQSKQEIRQMEDPLRKASHGCVIDFDENGLYTSLLHSSAICSLKVSTSSSFSEENTLFLFHPTFPPPSSSLICFSFELFASRRDVPRKLRPPALIGHKESEGLPAVKYSVHLVYLVISSSARL